jgi:hypothetical protein
LDGAAVYDGGVSVRREALAGGGALSLCSSTAFTDRGSERARL